MKLRQALAPLCLSAAAWSAGAGAASSVESQIAAIRQNYAAVNQNVKKGIYRKQFKGFGYCPGVMGQERTLWTDQAGTPRLYIEGAGSDDSAATVSYYLDERGQINFVFVEWNSVWNAVKYRLRLYYDEGGKVIRRLEEGLNWFDQSSLRRDVLKAFAAPYHEQC